MFIEFLNLVIFSWEQQLQITTATHLLLAKLSPGPELQLGVAGTLSSVVPKNIHSREPEKFIYRVTVGDSW